MVLVEDRTRDDQREYSAEGGEDYRNSAKCRARACSAEVAISFADLIWNLCVERQ